MPWKRPGVLIAIAVLLNAGALYGIHAHTREAYRSVGYVDGQLEQRIQTLKTIQQLTSVEKCAKGDAAPRTIPFLFVKPESFRAYKTANGDLRFCEE